jgi:hypothetical protein
MIRDDELTSGVSHETGCSEFAPASLCSLTGTELL